MLLLQCRVDDFGHTAFGIKKQTFSIDKTDIIAIALIIVFSLLCATRNEMSPDTEVYRLWYLNIINKPFWQVDGEYGLIFEFVSKVLGLVFGLHYRLYLFALPFINNVIVYKVLRKSDDVGTIGYLLYLYFTGFYYNYAVLRQGLAITFLIWALASWKNRKKLFALLMIASLAHNTAILALLVVMLVHVVQFGRKSMIAIWGIAFVNYLYPFSDRILGEITHLIARFVPISMQARYALYFLDAKNESLRFISLYYVFYFFIFLLLLLWVYDSKKNVEEVYNKGDVRIENKEMLNIGIFGLLLLSVGASFTVVIRLVDYMTVPCIIFLMPSYLKKMKIVHAKVGVVGLCTIALVLYLRIFY